jgi:hypothetical protein
LNEVKNVYVGEDVLLEELMARLSPTEADREPDAAPGAVGRMISERTDMAGAGLRPFTGVSGWGCGP